MTAAAHLSTRYYPLSAVGEVGNLDRVSQFQGKEADIGGAHFGTDGINPELSAVVLRYRVQKGQEQCVKRAALLLLGYTGFSTAANYGHISFTPV